MSANAPDRAKLLDSIRVAEQARYVGRAGAVSVTVNGFQELVEVKIEPKALSGDPGVLEKCVLSAANHAIAQATKALGDQLGDVAGALGFDLSGLAVLRGQARADNRAAPAAAPPSTPAAAASTTRTAPAAAPPSMPAAAASTTRTGSAPHPSGAAGKLPDAGGRGPSTAGSKGG